MSKTAHLVIFAAGAKAKDEQVTVGVGGGEVLPIRTTFTVKQCSVSLAFDLQKKSETRKMEDVCGLSKP